MWCKEGMPFFISDPPELNLPEYAKPWVEQYMAWEQRVGRENVWAEIRKHQFIADPVRYAYDENHTQS